MLDDQFLDTFDSHKEDQILYLPFCCGDPMDGLIPNTMDVSGEKALAVYANCGLHGLEDFAGSSARSSSRYFQ